MILAAATPSISKSALSAPKIRSTLSTLLGQSSGKRLVTAFTKRRFASAATVSSEASQNHTAIISTNAPISAICFEEAAPDKGRNQHRLAVQHPVNGTTAAFISCGRHRIALGMTL